MFPVFSLVRPRLRLWSTLLFLAFIVSSRSVFADPLTLELAWTLAEQHNPELRRVLAEQAAIEGEIKDASVLLYNNPTLQLEAGSRRLYQPGDSDSRRSEWSGGVSQTLELAGQQGLRRQIGAARSSALQYQIDETRRRVRAEVEERFVQVLALQQRIATEQNTLELIERNTSLAGKRVAAGEDSKLDGNLAIVDSERARNQVSMSQEQMTQARAALATTLQLPNQDLPIVQGELQAAAPVYTLDELLVLVENRPALQALSWREKTARSSLDFERAARYPDLTVSLMNGRDAVVGGQDNVTTLGFSLPLPIFRKNATAIGRATTELTQAEIDRSTLARDSKAEVVSIWLRRQSLQDRLQRLTSAVFPKLEENLKLSQIAFREGEIGLSQLLLVQRQTIDAQRDLIDAQLGLRLAQIELEYAAGLSPVAPTDNKK